MLCDSVDVLCVILCLWLNVTRLMPACVSALPPNCSLFEPDKRKIFCCDSNTSLGDNLLQGREMQQRTATIFEVARPEGPTQELSDGCPNSCPQEVSAW